MISNSIKIATMLGIVSIRLFYILMQGRISQHPVKLTELPFTGWYEGR
jgi:hypothetical protein